MQGEVLLFSTFIVPYYRLENVTNSVTKCQTSGTVASDVIFFLHNDFEFFNTLSLLYGVV